MNELPHKYSICLVIPYFGKWPFWIEYFLLSCRYNPTINWVIFTDCGTLPSCPPNVEIIEISYQDYCQLVSKKLDIRFNPNNPYKLCDIKPALGDIHAELLSGYDFWGFGDIDLVYGDLRAFFTQARLSKRDVFSNHKTRISGHLCLIRNQQDLNLAYQKVANWRDKFELKGHIAFDEKDFSKIFLRHKNSPKWIKSIAAWHDPMLKRAEFMESYSTPNARIPWLDGQYVYPKTWSWCEGQLTNDLNPGISFAYFHFLIWKTKWKSNSHPVNVYDIKHFEINELGFN